MHMTHYELIDSGDGEKLERFGGIVVRRPDPEVLWHKSADIQIWQAANLSFDRVDSKTGVWHGKVPESWDIEHGGIHFHIRPTSFKHVGIFPEQVINWSFIEKTIEKTIADRGEEYHPSVLNLFAYTGGATIAAAKAGAQVTHVDASKPVIEWAKENAALNGLVDAPIRYIVDDALAFAKREVKRGKKYDGIIMDPPAFGRGPDGETWKIEEHFLELFDACLELVNEEDGGPLFFIISGYASGYSALAFGNALKVLEEKYGGGVETLELILKESSSRYASLPAGVTARWSK